MKRVVVIGGGIAGLGAAYTLQKADLEVTVLESEPEAGGRMGRTEQWHGVWVWRAAGFFASTDVDAFEPLVRELGLLERRLSFRGGDLVFDVWRDGRANPLAFTDLFGFLRYRNIGIRGKLRLPRLLPTLFGQRRRGGDVPYEPWRASWCDDETVEEWLGRVAPEALETGAEVSRVVAGRAPRVEYLRQTATVDADAVVVAIPGSRVGGLGAVLLSAPRGSSPAAAGFSEIETPSGVPLFQATLKNLTDEEVFEFRTDNPLFPTGLTTFQEFQRVVAFGTRFQW